MATVRAPLFALPRLATSFVGTGIVTLALPQMVVAAVGESQKGLHLGSITAAASVASLAALYFSGVHSDRRRLGGGRRGLPVLWLSVMLVPLIVLAVGATYPLAVGAVLALVVARSLGDAAHLVSEDGQPLPMLATVAQQEARTAAANIMRLARGQLPEPFHYKDPGLLATIGRNAAVARLWGLSFSGFIAWAIWVGLHIYRLVGFRNRLVVMVNWAWDYVFYENQARLITRE